MNGIRNDNEKVNCIIERKAANQIITSDSKQLVTPFGNITTDPKLIHLTGEKLIFSCGDKESNTEEAINPSIKHISRLIIIGRNLSHEKNGQPEQISLQPTTNTSNGDAIAKSKCCIVVKNKSFELGNHLLNNLPLLFYRFKS